VTRSLEGRTLALDVDGVLLDPTGIGPGGWFAVVNKQFGVDASLLQSTFFDRAWADVIVGRTPIEPALAEALQELGWTMTVEDLLSCWFEADFNVDPEVLEPARGWAADGARLVFVTNQEHRRARYLQERLDSFLPTSGMAYSAAIGFVKADRQFFPVACDQLGLDRHDRSVVFVDDALANVESARRHGWTAVHFTPDTWHADVSDAFSSRH
jgi:putative hydrolase of the HAD superfamily